MAENFDIWLSTRLQELKTDEAVFGPYIKSILEGDEDVDEKVEGLDDLLVAMGGSIDAEALRNEILKRWEEATVVRPSSGKRDGISLPTNLATRCESDGSSVDQQLFDKLMTITSDNISSSSDQASSSGASKNKELSNPDPALRAAILSNYRADNSESDDDADDVVKGTKKKSNIDDDISKNDNSERVLNDQRELKEKAKQDAAKKRERDREDRAKQKQAAQDRKDKAKKKATKVERKR